MSKLKSNAGMESSQGKQRVYFSCHPCDFDTYFEELCNDILKIVNCAIYYYEPDEDIELDDDYYQNLEQMQLFVMPVTGNLLSQGCRAMDMEFRFARERHIPVLPIVLEGGLTDLFTRKFGNIQYLDKSLQDDTAISYEKKLDKFLSKILIGDELAAKIREAFDAYIFLSYRKKDRKYANQLMKLIHRNDFCRDIAIWYDEFLTPGENFNDAIADALTKSDLFVMAVTPNLINEENYIMATEYPMAIKEDKSILPVELMPTDQNALQEKYKGIPLCTDVRDRQALSDAMIAKLKDLAIQENAGDPQHDFFIGLAYLGGIDVEVDREQALKLIEGAADAGLVEAIQKMRDMYLHGEGVNLSLSKAVSWSDRLVARLEEQYQAEPTESNGNIWAKSFWDLGDTLDKMGKLEDAVQAFDRMRQLCLNLIKQWNSDETRRMLAASYWNLGSALKDMSDYENAKKYLENALKENKELYESIGEPRDACDLAVANKSMGDFIQEENPDENQDEALAYYMLSKELLDKAYASAESDEMQSHIEQNKANLYASIGLSYSFKNDLEKAELYSMESIRITEELCSKAQGKLPLYAIQGLGSSHGILGDIFMEKEEWDEALEHYLICADKYQDLFYTCHHSRKFADPLYYLYGQLDQLGQIHMSQQSWEKAEASCYRKLQLIEIIWEQETLEKNMQLHTTYEQLGSLYIETGRFDEAEKCYLLSLDVVKKIYEVSPTVEYGLGLANRHYNFGMLYRTTETELSINHYEAVISLCNQMSLDTKEPEIFELLSGSYKAMGDIHLQLKLIEDAREFYKYNIAAASELWNLTKEPDDMDNMATAYCDLATVSEKNDRISCLNRAIDLWEELMKQYPDRHRQYELKLSTAHALLRQTEQ